jgi:hypothetical protein
MLFSTEIRVLIRRPFSLRIRSSLFFFIQMPFLPRLEHFLCRLEMSHRGVSTDATVGRPLELNAIVFFIQFHPHQKDLPGFKNLAGLE